MKAKIRAIIGWDEKSDKGLDQATLALLALIREELPEEKDEYKEASEQGGDAFRVIDKIRAYNQCLQDIKHKLEEK